MFVSHTVEKKWWNLKSCSIKSETMQKVQLIKHNNITWFLEKSMSQLRNAINPNEVVPLTAPEREYFETCAKNKIIDCDGYED